MGESYMPLESLYSVVPILAKICNDGGVDQDGADADVIDRLLLERTVDLINQVVQARQARLTSERRRISKWVWGLLILLAMSSFFGVLLIQGGSVIINLTFCGVTIAVMTYLRKQSAVDCDLWVLSDRLLVITGRRLSCLLTWSNPSVALSRLTRRCFCSCGVISAWYCARRTWSR
jgi:hypothetical protein